MANLITRPIGTVLITGGGSGLGAAVARAVAEAGGRAIVIDRDVSRVTEHEAHEVDVAHTRGAEEQRRRDRPVRPA
jgi:NAD(P)-dependent dehydrogenase (short-subunit alcohol dehydrogenase family)